MKTQFIKRLLVIGGLATLFAAGGAHASDTADQKTDRTYTDPVTGEAKYATKLLSEMSDTEKALLSNEEYQALKELEAKLNEHSNEIETNE